MKKIFFYFLFIATATFTACQKYDDGTQLPYVEEVVSDGGLGELIEETDWQPVEIAEGIVWKHFHFASIFDSRQYINILDIDLSKNPTFEIPHTATGDLFTVSEVSEQAGADVAINGSYFGANYGGSTVYFKKNGAVITQTVPNFDSFRENAAFTISAAGRPDIVKKPVNGWDDVPAPYVLAGGPLLVYDGEEVPQLNHIFNTTRHPRTVIGVTSDNHFIMLVVDGRNTQSQGLTTAQLAELMLSLGCTAAVNMDGGGSSTAWTKSQGVVNHPTDNGVFDHNGQREVATAILVKAP